MDNQVLMAAQNATDVQLGNSWSEAKDTGLDVVLLAPLSIASVHVRKGKTRDLVKEISSIYALELPQGPHFADGEGVSFLGTGPGTWLALWPTHSHTAIAELRDNTSSLASITDQSSAYTIFKISGPQTGALLARGLAVSSEQPEFNTGDVVCSSIAHMGVIVWQLNDTPTIMVAVARSFSESFGHWLKEAISGVIQDT